MMFWTLVPAHAVGVGDWADHRQVHRAVMALFPPDLPGAPQERRAGAGILFRVDDTPTGRVLLIQSSIAPSRRPALAVVKAVHVGTALPEGALVRFRVAVNAVVRSKRSDGRATDVPLAEGQLDGWLTGKLAGALRDVTVLQSFRQVYGTDRRGARPGMPALQVDTVDGTGVVRDPDVLLALVGAGIGRGKAYGCGLLTVSVLS